MSKKRKLITFDWAIKRLLRSKANFGILEGFLTELLKEEITILDVLESEGNKDYKLDKFNRVDLKVRNSHQEIIIIEIQYDREYDYLQRIFYAVSKSAIEYMAEGQAYAGITKVISINILYFDLGSGSDYIYKGTTRFEGLHDHDLLELNAKQKELFKKDSVESLYPEYYLIKINRFNDIAKDTLDEWIYFLKNEEIKESFTAKGLKEAEEKLSIMKLPEDEQKAYEHYKDDLHYQASMFESSFGDGYHEGKVIGVQEGEVIGIQKGIELGAEQATKKLVLNMIQQGVSIEIIATMTGLSITAIEGIMQSRDTLVSLL
jgi:predicted transposase/invertase (TIGR01784 family)